MSELILPESVRRDLNEKQNESAPSADEIDETPDEQQEPKLPETPEQFGQVMFQQFMNGVLEGISIATTSPDMLPEEVVKSRCSTLRSLHDGLKSSGPGGESYLPLVRQMMQGYGKELQKIRKMRESEKNQ